MKLLAGFSFLILTAFSSRAHAATGACACTQAGISAAIAAALNGDTVRCSPAGQTVTWTTPVTIPNAKGITLDGNGASIAGSINLQQNANTKSRITGFYFVNISAVNISGAKSSAPFRVDHNTFTVTAGGATLLNCGGNGPGLIDHNAFNAPANAEMIHNTGMGASDASGWTDDIVPGSPDAVYVEDNTFANTGVSGNPAYFWGNSSIQSSMAHGRCSGITPS
jgi:hypothetical protein